MKRGAYSEEEEEASRTGYMAADEGPRTKSNYVDDDESNEEVSSKYVSGEEDKEVAESNYGADSDSDSSNSEKSSNEGEKPVQQELKKRDWMAEVDFDFSLDSYSSTDVQWEKLAAVYDDFKSCSRNFGRTIISEMHLPDEAKTIKPVSVGGATRSKNSPSFCSFLFSRGCRWT